MKTKTLSFIKKRIKKFLMNVHPLAGDVIKQYLSGNNFKELEKVLPRSKAKKINFPVLKDLAEALVDSNKFEEIFSYDLLLGDRYINDQHNVDSEEKIEFFTGAEFCSVDYSTALKDAYITLFLSDNLSDRRSVISITDVKGASICFKLFYRINIVAKKVKISSEPIIPIFTTERQAA